MISKCLCLVSECKYQLTPSLYWLKASPMDSSSITLTLLSLHLYITLLFLLYGFPLDLELGA